MGSLVVLVLCLTLDEWGLCSSPFAIGMLWSLFDQVCISQHVQAVLPFPQSHGEAVQKTILHASIGCNSFFRSFL